VILLVGDAGFLVQLLAELDIERRRESKEVSDGTQSRAFQIWQWSLAMIGAARKTIIVPHKSYELQKICCKRRVN
jgi:hypothetical protein